MDKPSIYLTASSSLNQRIEACLEGYRVFDMPLFSFKKHPHPNVVASDYSHLTFTSPRALHFFFQDRRVDDWLPLRLAIVGPKTEKAACDLKLVPHLRSEDANVTALADALQDETISRMLFPCGRKARDVLERTFPTKVHRLEVYDTSLNAEKADFFANVELRPSLFFVASPSAVDALADIIHVADHRFVAIGKTTASRLAQFTCSFLVAPTPTPSSIAATLRQSIKRA